MREAAGCLRRSHLRQRQAAGCTCQAGGGQQSAGQRPQDDVSSLHLPRCTLWCARDAACSGTASTRKIRLIWRTSTSATTTAAATRALALAFMRSRFLSLPHSRCSYAISRLARCEGLLQEWGTYIQSAASTARAMDEVQLHLPLMRDFTPQLCFCIRLQPSKRKARRLSRASSLLQCSARAALTP